VIFARLGDHFGVVFPGVCDLGQDDFQAAQGLGDSARQCQAIAASAANKANVNTIPLVPARAAI
jgi:hypothetical protein